jgi:hypothetical protein
LYRSNDLQEAEVRFLQLKDKVPLLVGISREVSIFSHKYAGRQTDQNLMMSLICMFLGEHGIEKVNLSTWVKGKVVTVLK